MTGTSQPRERHYANALDGLRAMCIILTVLVHIETLPIRTNGTIGVDIFFALSGWLITWLLLDEHGRTGRFNLHAFYIRRVFRIVPLYAVTIALYVLAALMLKLRGNPLTWNETMASLPWLLTFNPEFNPGHGVTFWHAWTLGIEEKFYLIWPALFLASRYRPFLAIGVALVLALTLTLLWDANPLFARGYWGLGCGAMLAIVVRRYPAMAHGFARASIALPLVGVIVAIHFASLMIWEEAPVWNMAVAFTAAFLVASLWCKPAQPAATLLSFGPFVWVGRLTYGIYLVHVLVLNAGRQLGIESPWILLFATYFGAVFVAWILHVMIERPLIDRGRVLAARVAARPLALGA